MRSSESVGRERKIFVVVSPAENPPATRVSVGFTTGHPVIWLFSTLASSRRLDETGNVRAFPDLIISDWDSSFPSRFSCRLLLIITSGAR